MVNDPTQLDKNALILTKAIGLQENGGKVNYNALGDGGSSAGQYQWNNGSTSLKTGQIPSNFASMASHYGLNGTDFSPENQNRVAYTHVKSLLDSGLTPAQVASSWNAGKGEPNAYTGKFSNGNASTTSTFDVPGYVKGVQSYAEKLWNEQPSVSTPSAPVTPTDTSGALFPSSQTDNPLVAGLKTIGNLPGSAFNFAKGVVSSINPLNTLKAIGDIGSGLSEPAPQGTGQLILDTITGLPAAAYKTLVPEGIKNVISGDFASAAKNFTNDPFGQVAPVVFAAEGGAKLADAKLGGYEAAAKASRDNFAQTGIHVMPTQGIYSAALDTAISKTAGAVAPITKLAIAPLSLAGGIAKSAASHLLGLEPTDLTNIIKNPEAFSKIAQDQASRGGLANEFGTALDTLDTHMQDTGAGYGDIRKIQTPVAVPENFLPDALNRFGLKIDEQGKVIADSNSVTRNSSDINAIQKFVSDWGNKPTLTANEYLNMRSDLADLANYDKLTGQGKTAKSQIIADSIRQEANKTIRPQIKGLNELDKTYSPVVQQFKQLRKDFLQKGQDGEYTFKDGAINKIANATGVGKEALLGRMEQVLPGITKKIQILKTVESIQKAYGNKVGTYARGILEGGGLLTGNIPAILAAIISNPTVAVPLLRGAGYTWAKVAPIVEALKIVAGDVNNLKKTPKQPIESPYVKPKISFGNGVLLTTEEVKQLQAKYSLKLNAPQSVKLPAQSTESIIAEANKVNAKKPGGLYEANQNLIASQKAAGIEPTGYSFRKNNNMQGGFITAGKNPNYLHPEDVKIMDDFIDYAKSSDKAFSDFAGSRFKDVERLAKKWDIPTEDGLPKIAKAFKDILDGKKKVSGTLVSGSLGKNVGNLAKSVLGVGAITGTGLAIGSKILQNSQKKK